MHENSERDVPNPRRLDEVRLGLEVVMHGYLDEISREMGPARQQDVNNPLCKDLSTTQCMVHRLRRAIVSQEIACPDIRVLREGIKAARDKGQRTGFVELVEYELQYFVTETLHGHEAGLRGRRRLEWCSSRATARARAVGRRQTARGASVVMVVERKEVNISQLEPK